MCSIAGSFSREWTEKALETMKHRSPDGCNVLEKDGFFIGAGRLAIVDKQANHTHPFTDGESILAFNGEIYNYLRLKIELTPFQIQWKTKTDTEVLFYALKHWGLERTLFKINGMYAFAWIDKETLTLCRDIAGEKPLYYTTNGEFASEKKVFETDVIQLQPAHYTTYWIKDRKWNEQIQYWKPEVQQINLNTINEELEHLIQDAVRIRTQDECGLYYSGGIDSTLISTLHEFQYKFTYDDSQFSREDFFNEISQIVWHLDEPIESFSPFGLWQLAKEASKKVKVVISGEGADELFGGYVRYLQNSMNCEAAERYPSYSTMFPYKETWEQVRNKEFNGNLRELLRMGDRMAAAFGIENRCPFLDKRIIEFAYSLPRQECINGTELKVILRRLLKKRKPDYQFPEKHGLFVSVNKWLGTEGFSKQRWLDLQKDIYDTFMRYPLLQAPQVERETLRVLLEKHTVAE